MKDIHVRRKFQRCLLWVVLLCFCTRSVKSVSGHSCFDASSARFTKSLAKKCVWIYIQHNFAAFSSWRPKDYTCSVNTLVWRGTYFSEITRFRCWDSSQKFSRRRRSSSNCWDNIVTKEFCVDKNHGNTLLASFMIFCSSESVTPRSFNCWRNFNVNKLLCCMELKESQI